MASLQLDDSIHNSLISFLKIEHILQNFSKKLQVPYLLILAWFKVQYWVHHLLLVMHLLLNLYTPSIERSSLLMTLFSISTHPTSFQLTQQDFNSPNKISTHPTGFQLTQQDFNSPNKISTYPSIFQLTQQDFNSPNKLSTHQTSRYLLQSLH